jgi:chromosome segregation ATPase
MSVGPSDFNMFMARISQEIKKVQLGIDKKIEAERKENARKHAEHMAAMKRLREENRKAAEQKSVKRLTNVTVELNGCYRAVRNLNQQIKLNRDPKAVAELQKRIDQYKARVEQLKKALDSPTAPIGPALLSPHKPLAKTSPFFQ